VKKTTSFVLGLFVAATVAAAADSPYVPSDAERARWTLQDMRSWRIALDAYKIDHKAYPAATTLDEARAAVQGIYIKSVPMHDAWGRPYLYEKTETGFRLVSAGADGKFDKSSWTTPGPQGSLHADAVMTEEGKFWFRSWSF
jgi:hypothetical protein